MQRPSKYICIHFFFGLFRAFTQYLGTIDELKLKPIDQIPPEEGIVIQSKPNVINERKYHFFIFQLDSNGKLVHSFVVCTICMVYTHTKSMSICFPLCPYIEYDHIPLSDLEIIGTLGVGGFGRVELVQYNKKETFALKILKKCDVACQGQIEHAYSEKEIMSSCDSPFIVKYNENSHLFRMNCWIH